LPRGFVRRGESYTLLSDVVDRPIALLLGDPGTGKSTELSREFNLTETVGKHSRLFVDGRLISTTQELESEWFAKKSGLVGSMARILFGYGLMGLTNPTQM